VSEYAPRQWSPEERPSFPGSPSFPAHPPLVRVAYLLVGLLVTLTGGLGNALVTANIVYLQGTLGAYYTEAYWLPTAYIMANASMNLLLVKFRQQFGLRLFTEFFLVLYALVTFAHLFVNDLGSAIAVRAAHGMVAAAVTPLGLFYTLQAFKKEWRSKGVVIAIGAAQLPLPLAYIFASGLLELAEWRGLYMFELGLSLAALAAVLALKLPPGDRFRAFRPIDFVTFLLFAPGEALLTAALTFGRIDWWLERRWIGVALAASIVLISAAIFIEHNRVNPLLNIRWLTSFNILRLAGSLMLVRIVLSEQSVGAVGFLRALGLVNDQMRVLFVIVLLATIGGIVVSALTINPARLMAPTVISLLCMALGAYLDAHATNLTRPEEMYFSQGLMAFGSTLFLGPQVVSLLGNVMANPANLISFSVLFGMTQNLGGMIGTSAVGTYQVIREKYHSAMLVAHMNWFDPAVANRIRGAAAVAGRVVTDPALRTQQGLTSLAASVRREANVLSYNDVFMLIAIIAATCAVWIFIHALWLVYFAKPAPQASAPVPGAPPPPESVTD
jgi:MFS family permease